MYNINNNEENLEIVKANIKAKNDVKFNGFENGYFGFYQAEYDVLFIIDVNEDDDSVLDFDEASEKDFDDMLDEAIEYINE